MRPIERLAAIEARAHSATNGPWFHRNAGVRANLASGEVKLADCPVAFSGPSRPDHAGGYADAEFIANAREDVPFLVAALREAWAELDAARAVLKSVEWRGPTIDTDPTERCPECDAMRFAEHRRDCVLAACLRGAK